MRVLSILKTREDEQEKKCDWFFTSILTRLEWEWIGRDAVLDWVYSMSMDESLPEDLIIRQSESIDLERSIAIKHTIRLRCFSSCLIREHRRRLEQNLSTRSLFVPHLRFDSHSIYPWEIRRMYLHYSIIDAKHRTDILLLRVDLFSIG